MSIISNYTEGKFVLVTWWWRIYWIRVMQANFEVNPADLSSWIFMKKTLMKFRTSFKRKYDESLNLHTLIASVRDQDNIEQTFEELRPEEVFHVTGTNMCP